MTSGRCYTVQCIVAANKLWRGIMKRGDVFHFIWFRDQTERDWFAAQYSLHYATLRKSVVLYALKRLERIFKMPMSSLEGNVELVALYETYLRAGKRNWRSFFFPTEIIGNPLQIITDDCSYGEEDYLVATENGKTPIPSLASVHEDSTVADYVRFITDYDTMCRNCNHLRITSALGSVYGG